MNVREVLEYAKKHKVQIVDLKFVDLIGTWQHFSIPTSELTEDLFKDGSGLDGSSIRGWKAINTPRSWESGRRAPLATRPTRPKSREKTSTIRLVSLYG